MNSSVHPLEPGTSIVFDPAAFHQEYREGVIEDVQSGDWGTLYEVRDAEGGCLVSAGESSIIREVGAATDGGQTDE